MTTSLRLPTGRPRSVETTIAAVVVTHETRAEVLACVASLRAAGVREITVVDCGSQDGTCLALRRDQPDVTVIATDNLGYGQAANLGTERTSAPYVLLLNADTTVVGGLGSLVTELDEQRDVAVVGPRVRYPDGSHQASARRLPSTMDAIGHGVLGQWLPGNPFSRRYRMLDLDPELTRDVDWLSGCALLIRRRAFEEVGGFDPAYFMYVEDVDLGWRLRRAGWRLRYQPAAEVSHVVGAATSRRRVRMVVEHARSLDRFYGRMHPHGIGRLLRPLVRVGLVGWALDRVLRRQRPAA